MLLKTSRSYGIGKAAQSLRISAIALILMGCVSPDFHSRLLPANPTASDVAASAKQMPNNSPRKIFADNPKVKLDARLVEASMSFGFNLFDRLSQQEPNKNIFISPTSVTTALSMTYNGTKGETQQAIARALKLQDVDINDVNDFNGNIQKLSSNGDPDVEVNIANSLWARQDIAWESSFLSKVQKFYQAEISNLDFSDPNSVNRINDWVKKQTKDKIPKIIDRIDRDSLLFLINAVYFKGKWENPFEKSLTNLQPFTLADGTKIQHLAMSRSGEYLYYDAPTFQAINLPYGNGRFSMQIFLPKPESNLKEFREQITLKNWTDWSVRLKQREGLIQLPKFKIEYDTSLKNVLQSLGMAIAFDPEKADFSNLSKTKAFIGDIKHKTFVEVNEEGTEAAAVTSIEMRTTAVRISEEAPFRMIVDRPFFLTISDRSSGMILFMGSIQNPAEN